MPWIEVIQEYEARGELREVYAKMHAINLAYGEQLGGVPGHDDSARSGQNQGMTKSATTNSRMFSGMPMRM